MDATEINSLIELYKELFKGSSKSTENIRVAFEFFLRSNESGYSCAIEEYLFEAVNNEKSKTVHVKNQIINLFKNCKVPVYKAKLMSKIVQLPKDDDYFELFKRGLTDDFELIRVVSAIGVLHYVSPYNSLLNLEELTKREQEISVLINQQG